jgi:tetratricopeptide (TPR) repeat protein
MNRFWLLLLLPVSLAAQAPKMKTGMNALKNEDYLGAISQFDGVIMSAGKPEERAEAHYYRAESQVKLYQYALHNRHAPLLHAYADAFARACEDYTRAAELDKATWAQPVQKELDALSPELIRDGLQKLEAAKKETDPAEKERLLQNATRCLQTAAKIKPQQYLPADLLGQIALEQKQYRQAEQYLRNAATLFRQYPPETPDLLASYIYYRLALIHRHYLHRNGEMPSQAQLQQALEYLRQAKSTLDTEYQRAGRLAGKLKSQDLERYQKQFRAVQDDFYYLELDLYLQLPELHAEALNRFRDALQKEPKNYTLTLAYAQLLERNDMQQALAMYQKAALLQPDGYEANYHIGIIFVNEAARMDKEAAQTPNIDRFQQLNALSREYLAKARPHLQAAYRSRPDNMELVNALLQVTLNLHMPEDYQRYKTRQKELGGK